MRKFLLIFFAILIPSLAYNQDVKSIFNKSKTSIVLILTYDSNNTPVALGSGFYFEKNLIATNYHVIDGSSKIVVKNLGTQTKLDNIKVRSYSADLDMAILETPIPNSTFLTMSQAKPEIGDKIVAIGNPKGLEGTVSTGIVSGLRELSSEYNLIQITSPISPGSSGGPVLNETGQVIGISTFTINDSQNLNFAIPSSIISSLKLKS
jgi:S1-C subfamily serine protease